MKKSEIVLQEIKKETKFFCEVATIYATQTAIWLVCHKRKIATLTTRRKYCEMNWGEIDPPTFEKFQKFLKIQNEL